MSRLSVLALNCLTHAVGAASGLYSIDTALGMASGAAVALFGHWACNHPQITKERT